MFKDRFDAAHQLVPYLKKYAHNPEAIVLAIPRGGLQLGYVLARELHLPLDVIFTKKIGYPGNPEYAIGAVSMEHIFISPDFTHEPWVKEYAQQEAIKIRALLRERIKTYRDDKPPLNLANKIVIVVDDGVATGQTLLSSLELIGQDKPQKIVVALPIASQQALEYLRAKADEVICLTTPPLFYGVGQAYQNFDQVDDEEALRLLQEANV